MINFFKTTGKDGSFRYINLSNCVDIKYYPEKETLIFKYVNGNGVEYDTKDLPNLITEISTFLDSLSINLVDIKGRQKKLTECKDKG